jgi:hypothetical protein
MALVAYSPVARGRIKGDATLARIGQAHGKTAAQVCLRWLVQQSVSAIPRTSKIERLSENIDVFDFALSDEEMRQIFGMASARGPADRFRLRAEMGLRRAGYIRSKIGGGAGNRRPNQGANSLARNQTRIDASNRRNRTTGASEITL